MQLNVDTKHLTQINNALTVVNLNGKTLLEKIFSKFIYSRKNNGLKCTHVLKKQVTVGLQAIP